MTRAFRPTSLAEAVRLLADPDLAAIPLAGGTDLLVPDRARCRRPAAVVDVSRLPPLRGIRVAEGRLDLGAACTLSEILEDPLVGTHAPLLAAMAAAFGGWQIRNCATLGGNIANASPAGDALPALLALDAEFLLSGPDGERVVPAARMFTGYRQTALRPGELIVRVRLPLPPAGAVQAFRKVASRAAQAIAKVVVAFAARRQDGRLVDVRFAAGSVAPTPVRLVETERTCEGCGPTRSLGELAAAAARAEVHPIDDVRSTAAYRLFVLGTVVRRMVLRAAEA